MTAAAQSQDRIAVGIGAMLVAMAGFSGMDGLAKLLGESYPINQIVFFRNAVGLLPFLAIVLYRGRAVLKTENMTMHRVRGLTILIAQFTFFYGLQFMGLADAMAIAFATPLFITALSMPVLKEKVGVRRWSAVLIGFFGVLWIVQPGSSLFQPAALLVLTAAFAYAILMLLSRKLARTDNNISIMFHATLTSVVGATLLLPFGWVTPGFSDLMIFVALGLLGSGSVYFIVIAYRHAPAAVVSPYEYTALLWGTFYGWLIWRELPDDNVWTGGGIVVASGLYILYRETRGSARVVSEPGEPPAS